MKKRIFLLLLILSLLSLAVFVSATNWGTKIGPVILREGWNLVYGFLNPDQLDGQALEKSHIKAIYAYIPTTGEYLRAWPNPDSNEWQNLDNVFDDHELLQTAFWVYTDKDANTEYWLYDEPVNVEERTMYAGWNFLGITPDMISKSLNDIKGDCEIIKAAVWDADRQKWDVLSTTELEEGKFNEEMAGLGLVVKVSDDCRLGQVSGITPPPLPEESIPEPGSASFPETIGEFTLESKNIGDDIKCSELNGTTVCGQGGRLQYATSDNREVHILPIKIISGKETLINYLKATASESNVDGIRGVYRGAEPWELFWFPNKDYDMIRTQDYKFIPQADGDYYSNINGTTNTSVVKWFLNKYPPTIN